MSKKTTAKVETLTAQVRVLMVGNRQITLSVARQLDHVDSLRAEQIMGRVRIGKDRGLSIIGQNDSGDLVICPGIPRPRINDFFECPDDWKVCRHWNHRKPVRVFSGENSDETCVLYFPPYEGQGIDEGHISGHISECKKTSVGKSPCQGKIAFLDMENLKREEEAALADYRAALSNYETAAAAPLIVLAGLK